MPELSQITFDFSEERRSAEPSVGVRVKALKNNQIPVKDLLVVKKPGRGRRALKELELEAESVEIPEDEVLFQKQYYTIGEVAKMFRVNTSLIRTWENEFDIIEPRKNRKGDRYFRPIDIKNLVLIHNLIRLRKFTLEGARDYIRKNKKAAERFEMIESLTKIRSFLLEVKANL